MSTDLVARIRYSFLMGPPSSLLGTFFKSLREGLNPFLRPCIRGLCILPLPRPPTPKVPPTLLLCLQPRSLPPCFKKGQLDLGRSPLPISLIRSSKFFSPPGFRQYADDLLPSALLLFVPFLVLLNHLLPKSGRQTGPLAPQGFFSLRISQILFLRLICEMLCIASTPYLVS